MRVGLVGGILLERGLAADVVQGVAVVLAEVRVLELPGVVAVLVAAFFLGGDLDLVEVVLVELAHEAGKVAVLEVPREDLLGELVGVEHHKAVAAGRPPHNVVVAVFGKHGEEFLDKVVQTASVVFARRHAGLRCGCVLGRAAADRGWRCCRRKRRSALDGEESRANRHRVTFRGPARGADVAVCGPGLCWCVLKLFWRRRGCLFVFVLFGCDGNGDV